MDINEVLKLVPEYVAKTLSSNERKLVDELLPTSKELQEEVRYWQELRAVVRVNAKFEKAGHLTSEEVVQYCMGEFSNNPIRLHAIKKHLTGCDLCQTKTKTIGEFATSPRTKVSISFRWQEWLAEFFQPRRLAYVVPIAAALVIVALVLVNKYRAPQDVFVSSTLEYSSVSRGTPDIAVPATHIRASKDVTRLELTIQVPKSLPQLGAIQYTISWATPSGSVKQYEQNFTPGQYNLTVDTVHLSIPASQLTEGSGKYLVHLREILSPQFSATEPKEYYYHIDMSIE